MHRTRPRDEGAALLFIAMTMLLLLGITALVIDLAGLRFDRRADRLASDFGARAGAAALDPFQGSVGPEEACQRAADYVLINLGVSGWDTAPPCLDMAAIPQPCLDSTAQVTVTGDTGPYHIEISYPVPDANPLMDGQVFNDIEDGSQCQRIGVRVQRDREFTFARVLGFDQGSTDVRSVALFGTGQGLSEIVPLVILEPHSCSALYTSGQGKVTVGYHFLSSTPGLIVVDSDGTDCGPSNPYAIDSKGTQQGWIRALPVPNATDLPNTIKVRSAILSYALQSGTAANAYDPDDLTSPIDLLDLQDPIGPDESWFRLYPTPIPTEKGRVTRAPIDHRYNCNGTYSDPYFGLGIASCPEAPDITPVTSEGADDGAGDYIDQLENKYGGTGNPGFINVWTTYTGDPNYPTGYPCQLDTVDNGFPNISVSGDWYVNCPGTTGNNGFSVKNSVTFNDGDVVFEGQVRTVSSGSLRINPGSNPANHIVYIRHGDFVKDAQSTITLTHVVVYLAEGRVDFNGGSGGLTWEAPDVPEGVDPATFPDHFDDLALWSESSDRHHIGGQAGNELTGTFFTPYADPFELSGQGTQVQLSAQFVTRKLELSGQAEVLMTPTPDRSTPISLGAVTLIR